MVRPIDVSARATRLQLEPMRESPVDISGRILGETMQASQAVQSRGILAEASAAEQFSRVAPDIAQTGIDAYTGYAKAQLDKEHNQTIENFVNAQKDPQSIVEGYATAGMLDQGVEQLFDHLAKGDITGEKFATTVNAFNEQATRLRTAYEQGMIQPSELVDRLEAITREHIRRNPGLTDELLQHSNKTLQLSGIRSLKDIKNDTQDILAKQQEDAINDLAKDLQAANIGTNWTLFRTSQEYRDQEQERLIDYQKDVKRSEQFKRGFEVEKLQDEGQVRQWSRGGTAERDYRANWMNFNQSIMQTVSRMDIPEEQRIQILEQQYADSVSLVRGYLGDKGALTNPEGKAYLDRFEAQARITIDQLKDATDQSTRLKILNNTEQMIRTASNIKLFDKVNPATMNLIQGLSPILEKYAFSDPARGQLLFETVASAIDSGLRSTGTVNSLLQGQNTPESGRSDMSVFCKDCLVNDKPEQFSALLDSWHKFQTEGGVKPVDHLKGMSDFFALASLPENAKQIPTLSTQDQRKMSDISTNYLVFLSRKFQQFTNEGSFAGEPFTVSELPGGGFVFMSDNKAFKDQLNATYGNRINQAAETLATLYGISKKDSYAVIKEMFKNNFQLEGRTKPEPGSITDRFIDKVFQGESSGRADAKNPRSSALGAGQFINETWLSVMNQFFPDEIQGKSQEEILEMRKDPNLAREATKALAEDNARILRSRGITVNDTSLRLAHFLGGPEASKLLQTPPNTRVDKVLRTETIRDNPEVLRNKSVQDVINWARAQMQ